MQLNPGILNNWIVLFGEAAFLVASLFFLGLLVTVKRRTPAGRWFWLLIFCIFAWGVLGFLADLSADVELTYWIAQSTFVGPAFIPYLYVLFANALRLKPISFRPWHHVLLILPALGTLALAFTDHAIIRDTYVLTDQGYASEVGFLYPAFLFYLVGYVAVGARLLVNEYRTTRSKLKRLQLGYVLVGSVVATVIISITHLALPTFMTGYYPLGSVGAIFFSALVGYAVFRHRFLDVRRALIHVFVNFITFVTLFVGYGIIGLFILGGGREEATTIRIETLGGGDKEGTISLLIFGFLLVVLVTLPWLWPRLRRLWLQTMLPASPKPTFVVPPHEKNLLDLGVLGEKVEAVIESIAPVKTVRLYAKQTEDGPYRLEYPRGQSEQLAANDEMLRYFKEKPRLLVREEVPFIREEAGVGETDVLDRIAGKLEGLTADVAIPLASGELYGLILLGEKKSGEAFTVQDLQLFGHVQTEATMALMNVIIYKSAMRQAGVKI